MRGALDEYLKMVQICDINKQNKFINKANTSIFHLEIKTYGN